MSFSNTVIVVEDDASMGMAVERLLGSAGWKTILFSSAEAFLEAGVPEDARALVLDIQLPGISGFELQEQLAVLGSKTPIIFMTAHDRPWARARAETAGAIGYLAKPFGAHRLIELLNAHSTLA